MTLAVLPVNPYSEAVNRALEVNNRYQASNEQQQAAASLANAAGGALLPTAALHDEFQRYAEPFTIAFGPIGFTARDENTNTLAISATQPILGLLHRSQEYQAARKNSSAAKAMVRGACTRIQSVV